MFETNEDKLAKQAVVGQITHPLSGKSPYNISSDGEPVVLPGVGGISYNFRVGDNCVDIEGDHVEPGVSISNFSKERGSKKAVNAALNVFSCVGNEAEVISGSAEGKKGTVTGKHGGVEHVIIDFDTEILEELNIEDKIEIRAHGVGFKLLDYEDITLVNMSPELLKKMPITEENSKVTVPVTHKVPAKIMGSGLGADNPYRGDYDIQMFDKKTVEEHDLDTLRVGDIIAVTDAQHSYGRIYRRGAVSVGIVVHSNSVVSGHGPGVTTLITGKTDQIETVIDEEANIASILNLRG